MPLYHRGFRDQRLVIRRTGIDPLRDEPNRFVAQLRLLGRDERLILMANERHQPTLARLARDHRSTIGTRMQQALAGRQVEIPLDLLAAMAFHAVLDEQGANVTSEDREAVIRRGEGWKSGAEEQGEDCKCVTA